MTLPEIHLDDLRFQRDLVDEARKRIIRYCPEWTEYNVSDPGITLIELFAWMTEQIVYRLNRVPEKNYVKFLDMLGVQLLPASSARALLTFRLSAPFPLRPNEDSVVQVPKGLEVATQDLPGAPKVIFTTDAPLVIASPHLTQLRTREEIQTNYIERMGLTLFSAFRQDPPQPGATFYLGFDPVADLRGHILRLAFACEPTEAVGVRRDDPPLVWECSTGDDQWFEIKPSDLEGERDTTGGLNNERGEITFYLPLALRRALLQGLDAQWLRCRFEQRNARQGLYTRSPRIVSVSATTLGAATWATHAVYRGQEQLGVSDGDPDQRFRLAFAPILDLTGDETVAVEEIRDGEAVFIPWQRVASFANSDQHDRHYCLDTATGEVSFGPNIRQPNGAARQYGRVPGLGRRIIITGYRHGGGAIGDVPANRIQFMQTAVPYIDRVTNLQAADGGRDQESLQEAVMRARRELRAQNRAVTAEDYENLALAADRGVARIKCITPDKAEGRLQPGAIEILVVPVAHKAVAAGELHRLEPDARLLTTVQRRLDQYRLLTTHLQLRGASYVGVQVHARVVAGDYADPNTVSERVLHALRFFLAPLALAGWEDRLSSIVAPTWEGWPFGKALYAAELYSLIQQVRGVKHVLEVTMRRRAVEPNRESPEVRWGAGTPGLTPVEGSVLTIPQDTLLCSLDHQIELVTL